MEDVYTYIIDCTDRNYGIYGFGTTTLHFSFEVQLDLHTYWMSDSLASFISNIACLGDFDSM